MSFSSFLKSHKIETILLCILLVASALLRFPQLGFSHFYGDETKTIYWNKTIPASQFLLNQRKGPLQFVVVWAVEKFTGGFSEGAVRFPFAVAGFLSVVVFYLLVRRMFNWKTAIISASLFSFNGFFIAFSRTAQYQSFLILFSLLSIYLYFLSLSRKSNFLCLVSAISWMVAFSFHYDALFYLVPIIFTFVYFYREKTVLIKDFLLFFLVPIALFLIIFFAVYMYGGFSSDSIVDYLSRRITGQDYKPNSSFYTFLVYSPFWPSMVIFLTPLLAFFTKYSYKRNLLLAWFLVPFVVFQVFVRNPGTHILNYILPLFILTGYLATIYFKRVLIVALSILIFLQFLVSFAIYIPVFDIGYPWKNFGTSVINFKKADKSYNLFLYGFPYNRGWDEIRQYMLSLKGVRGVYTNDNATLASYYLKELPYTAPGLHFLPQYYIKVMHNQEIQTDIPQMRSALPLSYVEVTKIYFDNKLSAIIYKNLNYVPVAMQ